MAINQHKSNILQYAKNIRLDTRLSLNINNIQHVVVVYRRWPDFDVCMRL